MLVAIHVLCALTSLPLMLAAVTVEVLHKAGSKVPLKLSALSFAGLVASGTGLITIDHVSMLGVCVDGLLYFGGLGTLYLVYQKLLSREKSVGHIHD